MTKEQSIKTIKEHCYFANLVPDAKKALDMAIKALEQQSSDDCVSREKVWYMITGGKYANEDYEQFIDRLVKELENMPLVTPTHGNCKDCAIKQLDKSESAEVGTEKYYCPIVSRYVDETPSFYCADFERKK